MEPSDFLNPRKIGIESFYCRPGIEGAHEKGGVEGMIGYFRLASTRARAEDPAKAG
ncbi:hypothetical protein [Streptomyces lunaelactis]|uniref:hypothetical protein n=1 Tax=Streptomyces lunaelactis TaxID=1535768 RepID=UPI00131ED3BF|nr:hypothetical protein [Streptomyces lunaelactis]NUK85925.1 hypothetical protein [Streptomyces lunaelactis]